MPAHTPPTIGFMLNRGYSLFHPEVVETYGGAQLDMYLLGRELQKKGYAIAYAFLDYGQKRDEVTPDGVRLYATYPPRALEPLVGQFIRAFGRLWRVARQMDADIYCVEGANFEVFVIGLFCRVFRKTMVYRLASMIEADGRYTKENRLQGILYSLGRRLAHAIIAQSQEQCDLLRAQGIRATIIPNGYPPSEQMATPNGPVLWVGRLMKIKGPGRFLDLAEQLPNQQFVMIGPTEMIDRVYAETMRERIAALANVDYFTKVDFHVIDRFFQRSSVLVNSSEYEGFPLTFLQAMSVGLPIVSYGINPDGILTDLGGSVVSNVAGAVQALRELQQFDEWKRRSDRAKAIFRERFSLELILPKYEELFQTILR